MAHSSDERPYIWKTLKLFPIRNNMNFKRWASKHAIDVKERDAARLVALLGKWLGANACSLIPSKHFSEGFAAFWTLIGLKMSEKSGSDKTYLITQKDGNSWNESRRNSASLWQRSLLRSKLQINNSMSVDFCCAPSCNTLFQLHSF